MRLKRASGELGHDASENASCLVPDMSMATYLSSISLLIFLEVSKTLRLFFVQSGALRYFLFLGRE